MKCGDRHLLSKTPRKYFHVCGNDICKELDKRREVVQGNNTVPKQNGRHLTPQTRRVSLAGDDASEESAAACLTPVLSTSQHNRQHLRSTII